MSHNFTGSNIVTFSSLISNLTFNNSLLPKDKNIFSDTKIEQLTHVYNYHLLYHINKEELICNLVDITSDASDLSLCYDLLYVNQRENMIPYDLFWNCMKLLNYNFAYLDTIFHKLLYQFSCTLHKTQMTMHEALLLIMVLKNKCIKLTFSEFINDFIRFIQSNRDIDINTWNNQLFCRLLEFKD